MNLRQVKIPEVKVKRKHVGQMGLGLALFLFIGDLSDLIAKYQNWEFYYTTEFASAILKLVAGYGASFMAGAGTAQNHFTKMRRD